MEVKLKEFLYRSIKYRMISVFLSIILVMLLISIFFMYFQFKIIGSYNEVIENMQLEREISKTVPVIIQDYNDLSKNIGNPERNLRYINHKQKMEDIFLHLDRAIISEESSIIYIGLKNIVKDIIIDCDKGIEDIRDGNISTYSYYYSEATRKSYYVDETNSQLLAKEIEYSELTQERINDTHKTSLILGVSLIILITLGCIIFSFLFSNELIRPLNDLLVVVGKIKSGNLKVRSLSNSDDEIGRLGFGFNEMIDKIESSQKELNIERDNLEKSKHALEKKINELEKFQKLTVDREIKMIGLKKQIQKLEDGQNRKDAKK